MKDNTRLFLGYIAACESRNLDLACRFYAVDACFLMMPPTPPANGIESIRTLLGEFFNSASEIRFEILSIAESETGFVLTERIDRFLINGIWLALKVMGAVDFSGGKITSWREYYDSRQMEAEYAKLRQPSGAIP